MQDNERYIDTSVKGIIAVALPISLSTFVQFVVIFTDNYFLSLLSPTALNAAGNSGILYLAFTMLAVGLSSAVQILGARRKGEGSFVKAGELLVNAILMAMVLGALLFALILITKEGLLHLLIKDNGIRDGMLSFLSIRALGFLIYPVVLMYIGFYSGIAKTRILFYITLVMAFGNLLGDYLLIFGNLGFPKLGLNGAAWASFFAECLALILVLLYSRQVKFVLPYQLANAWKALPTRYSSSLMQIGIPLMGQQFLAVGTWTLFFFLVEKMGEGPLFISHITRTLYFLAFVSAFGLAQTTKTYISTLIAERRQSELNKVILRLFLLNLGGVLLLTHGFILYPATLFSLFTDSPEVVAEGSRVLSVIFFAAIMLSFSSILLNTVEGAGRTKQALWIEAISIVAYLGVGYWVIILHPLPIHQVWMLDYLYFGLEALLAGAYLLRTPWKYTQI